MERPAGNWTLFPHGPDPSRFAFLEQCGYVPVPMDNTRWVVATTKANREAWAMENLARQDCPYYYPKITELIRSKRKRELQVRPLFKRYVFVEVTKRWHFLLGTFGIQGVIMAGDNPAWVSRREIDRLKSMEDDNGMIVLPDPPMNSLQLGQQVHVNGGMLQGYTGIYQGQHSRDREKVLIAYLGRKTTILIASRHLAAA